jgi:hypothetical protein
VTDTRYASPPSPTSSTNNAGVRRLLNVALTRAQRRLILVGDFDYIAKTAKKAFIRELVDDLRAKHPIVSAANVIPTGLAARAARASFTREARGFVEAGRLVVLQDSFYEHLYGEQFPAGQSNLTYLLRAGDWEAVLRRPPLGHVLPTAHDMAREYRWLAAIHPAFPLAPRPYLLCEDASVLGAVFYVMERRRGIVVRHDEPMLLADHPDGGFSVTGGTRSPYRSLRQP